MRSSLAGAQDSERRAAMLTSRHSGGERLGGTAAQGWRGPPGARLPGRVWCYRPAILLAFLSRLRRAAARSPLEASLALAAVGVTLYVIGAPLAATRYLPMVDLPFHAASGGTLRHYWDPSYHQREQFSLHPISIPYLSMYAVQAVAMLVFPMEIAVKIAVAVMLLLVPAGLAVLFHGARKSPLLGLLGLPLCWGNLTHWGFLNYVGALGLFAMIVGLTLLVLDHPTRARRLGLLAALGALYFTHIFRYPFGIAAVVGTAVVMLPATRRVRPVLLPLLFAIALFALWWKIRPATLEGTPELHFTGERLTKELSSALTDGFNDDGVKKALIASFDVAWLVALVSGVHAVVRWREGRRRFTAWDAGVTLVPLGCAVVFLILFLVMPMWLGLWWYVYPREATASVIILCGACPDLPRTAWLRVPLVAAMSLAAIRVGRQVAERYADFAPASEELHQITRRLPRAPKLFYMVFDHTGTNRSSSPFLHLPAYVQAEKGGWLSWHFAVWNAAPLRYRVPGEKGAVVGPLPPHRWEWTPQRFNLGMTPFFDWFLVRQRTAPDKLFAADPSIVRVDHVGTWWLYRRNR